jgi:hypothetical protein
MPTQALFGISVAFGFIAWGIVAAQYFWPLLRAQARVDALRTLLILHSFRFIGLAFLVPGVVAPELPSAFAVPAAYGDLIAAVLALFALAALRSSSASFWPGHSTSGAVLICSTPSIKPTLPGFCRANWQPRTSFRLSLFRCS